MCSNWIPGPTNGPLWSVNTYSSLVLSKSWRITSFIVYPIRILLYYIVIVGFAIHSIQRGHSDWGSFENWYFANNGDNEPPRLLVITHCVTFAVITMLTLAIPDKCSCKPPRSLLIEIRCQLMSSLKLSKNIETIDWFSAFQVISTLLPLWWQW